MTPSHLRLLLLTTVCITGAAVLILEIFAIRLLSPHFGTSMFVLSSVLTVVLLALALGYFFGGRIADRYPHPVFLYGIIALSGLALITSYALAKLFLPYAPALFSITSGPLVLACIFFFLPAFLLGTDSPFVIKLLTSNESTATAGATTGSVFFWSTLGSIVGSLSAGFLFIPFVGIERTLIGITCVLVLGSTVAAYLLRTYPGRDAVPFSAPHFIALSVVALLLCGIVTNLPHFNPDGPNQRTLYEADGYYGHIRIFEEEFSLARPPARFLRREVNSESAMFQDSYDHLFPYTRFSDLYPQLRKATTTSLLMLGGGAYTIPRNLLGKNPALQIDVVELEPSLYPLAQTYFDLPGTDQIRNHVMDARVYVAQDKRQYDFIFMDTFNSGLYIPAHLTTQEFFITLRDKLTPDGLLMINFIGARELPGTTLTDSFARTLSSVFPSVRAFSTATTTPQVLQNIIFIANPTDTPVDVTDIVFPQTMIPLEDMEIFLRGNDKEQVIFTDDRSPAEYLVAKQIRATQNTR